MKLRNLLACFFLGFIATSCIKDEAPNAEADIETCTVPGDVLNRDPIIGNEQITLPLKKGTDITKLAPGFTLTDGATIYPASGTARDFTTDTVTYTVTSQDGRWKKKYKVSALFSGLPTSYHFEKTIPFSDKNGKTIYYNFRESDGLNAMDWANANEGFNYTGVKAEPEEYPTAPAPNGVKGNCVKLTTKSTGSLGAVLKMYIAAGNLFTGSFTLNISNVLKATKFGVPFTHIPTSFKGYYKYKAGETFTISGKPDSSKKDICDIYAVFYETDDNMKTLDGTNVFSVPLNPNIISIARIDNAKNTEQWTEFNLPFVTQSGKTVDRQKLDDGLYNLAIVFSSSIRGDYFEGAVGSTLYIDEVELSYTDIIN